MRSGVRLGRDEKIFLAFVGVFSVFLGALIIVPGFFQGEVPANPGTTSGIVVGRETIEAGTPDIQVEVDSSEDAEGAAFDPVRIAAVTGGCLIIMGAISGIIAWMYFRGRNKKSSDESESIRESDGKSKRGGGGSSVLVKKKEVDPLRELPNRQDFLREILTALEDVESNFSHFALFSVKIWLDEESQIPSRYHHNLLISALRRLEEFEFKNSMIARISSSEFAIIIREPKNRRELGSLATRIMNELKYPVEVDDREFKLNTNIAVGIYPEVGYTLKTILDNLNWTMEFSIRIGKNEFKIFSEDVIIEIYDEMVLKNHLNTSLEKEEYEVYYQPIVDIKEKKIVAVEALLRWKHPNIGLIRPLVFLRLIEDTDLIIPIGAWVFERICRDRLIWQEKWLRVPRVHINLSARQLHRVELPRMVEQMKEEYALDPNMIEFEIDEHALFEEAPDGTTAIMNVQKMGVRVSVSGFGTPISQLNRMINFKFNSLKIMREFTANVLETNDAGKIAPGLIRLGQKMGVDVISEGVENLLELQKLMEYDIRYIQGYFIAEPMPEIAIRKLLSMPFEEAFPDLKIDSD